MATPATAVPTPMYQDMSLKVALQWKQEVNNEIHLLCMIFTVEPATTDPCGLLLTCEGPYGVN